MPELPAHRLYRMYASPFFWGKKADELKHAADLLWPECVLQLEAILARVKGEVQEPYTGPPMTFMIHAALAGFSIECLLKGTIIKTDQTLISNGNLSRKLQTHDLVKLAKLANVHLSKEEHYFCEQVKYDMENDFRYPSAKSHLNQRGTIHIGRAKTEVYNELFNRLRPDLNV